MNNGSKTNQQLVLEIDELRAKLDVARQRLQEANERMQAGMTECKGTEQVLEGRLRFETLLAEISAGFVNLPADRIDSEIEDAQRRICELLDLDRSTLWQVPEGEPETMLLTHIGQAAPSASKDAAALGAFMLVAGLLTAWGVAYGTGTDRGGHR